MEYHVVWEIDVDAESFDEAVRTAREIQRDPNSIATHFTAMCKTTGDLWDSEKGYSRHSGQQG